MAWENERRPKRPTGCIVQENFFDMIPGPDFPVLGLPSRSRQQFWREDVLPTTNLLRRIYVPGYQHENEVLLEQVWEWLMIDENKLLVKDGSLRDPEVLRKLPPSVVINYQTALFFLMEGDFKQTGGICEAFVAYAPRTDDWENDVRRITFDYVSKLKTHPYEVSRMSKKTHSMADIDGIAKKVGR